MWWRDALVGVLRKGPVPRHVAFIMDGNRRYARKSHMKTIAAHSMGFETLKNVCVVLGDRVAVYTCTIAHTTRLY